VTEYKPGDVVNGHVFTGTEWVPLNVVDQPPPPPGAANPYAGMTWDGKRWVAPVNGVVPVAVPRTFWQRNGTGLIVVLVILVLGFVFFSSQGAFSSSGSVSGTSGGGTNAGISGGGAAVDTRRVITKSGPGKEVTGKFTLEGDYSIAWTTGGDCTYYGDLEPGNNSIFQADTALSGRNNIYGLSAGTYWIDVNTFAPPECPWTVTLTPQ
jgi:hypothetical protein